MKNTSLEDWVGHVAAHTKPDEIRWCSGTESEARQLEAAMVKTGELIPLSEDRFPRSFIHRSDPNDVARTEARTFISTPHKEDVGPTNNWMSSERAHTEVWPLFAGSMRGRTLYVVPYLMGPPGSKRSRVGVQLTDSAYVVRSLRTMTRMGRVALDRLAGGQHCVRGMHSLGTLDPERRFVVHFPALRDIWSIGSGYGGNALLSKKCHALRMASVEAFEEGWLAEHMMIAGVRSPRGAKHYVAAAFPSGCGKTNLAMLVSALPGWSVETVGDDICWMHIGDDGRLWAINPEAGFFGVAPGTSYRTNPHAMVAMERDTIFTNVALREDGTPWWEGMEALSKNEVVTDWRGRRHRAGTSQGTAAHPNARFTVGAAQCPSVGDGFRDPRGVPISAIIFGGRHARLAPLVYEARDWEHGVYIGATLVSETTAAATGEVGVPRHDPMAMLPFCGYNMADYFLHWLSMGRRLVSPPRIFHVNWFRTNDAGKLLWPGFGDNVRVLKWIVERIEGRGESRASTIGYLPTPDAIDRRGLDVGTQRMDELLSVDPSAWLQALERTEAFLDAFGARLPEAILEQHRALRSRLIQSCS